MESQQKFSWTQTQDRAWVQTCKNKEGELLKTKIDNDEGSGDQVKKPAQFEYHAKKHGTKGTHVYTPKGYGIVQEEQNKDGQIIVKINNDQLEFKV